MVGAAGRHERPGDRTGVGPPRADRDGGALQRRLARLVLAKSVVVIKRSMGHGYAGIDNELYTDPKTGMFFTDAKKGLSELGTAVGEFVG
ncbi:NAD(P)(+) transhydrogenase (Re/Si-specific) subunit beta [Streptomyces sp. NPDC002172]